MLCPGSGISLSVLSWGSGSSIVCSPAELPARELNSGKLLNVSVKAGFESNGADVPDGEGIRLGVGSGLTSS